MFKYCQRLNTIYRVSLCCELSYWQSCNSQWLLHTVSRSRNGALVFIYTKLYFEIVLFLPACYFKSEVTVVRTQAVCLQTPGTATIQRQHYHLLEFLMFQVTFTPFSQSGLSKATGHVHQSAATSSQAAVCPWWCPNPDSSQLDPPSGGCRVWSSVLSWDGRRTLGAV